MYNKQKQKPGKTSIKINESYVAETIEAKVFRILNNKEPISDGAPLVYTDRKDGIKAEYDIRTDKWEVAIDATSAIDGTHKTRREQSLGERTYDTMTTEQQTKFNEKFPKNKHAGAAKTGGEGQA